MGKAKNNKPKKAEKTHKHVSDVYRANCEFGTLLENGEPKIIFEGETFKVIGVDGDKVRLEILGWLKTRSIAFRFLDKVEPHQYTINEVLDNEG